MTRFFSTPLVYLQVTAPSNFCIDEQAIDERNEQNDALSLSTRKRRSVLNLATASMKTMDTATLPLRATPLMSCGAPCFKAVRTGAPWRG